jgi:hypothetical protein
MIIRCDFICNKENKFSHNNFLLQFQILRYTRFVMCYFFLCAALLGMHISGPICPLSDILFPYWLGRNTDIFTIVFDTLTGACLLR